MAWQDSLVMMVRSLINDMGATPTYTDERIEGAIVISGLMVTQEFPFTTTYTFDLSSHDISPDPIDEYDGTFIALVGLKAACMLTITSYQQAIGGGIKVRSGNEQVDTTGSFGGYSDLIKNGPCAAYERLLKSILWTGSSGRAGKGKAVLGPHSSYEGGYCDPRSVREFYDCFCF